MGVSDKSVVSITTAATSSRLKREDCKRTKHDTAFSEWKILVGPSDWEDYLLRKDNTQKYRTHNIPNCSSCSGVYELGIAVSLPQSGRRGRNLSSKHIIPVYVGHADNIRSRLQQYGREGAHLEKGGPNVELNESQAKGLFKEIFSKGFAVGFRWAPMKNKSDAEKTEARLLSTFDYAWNKEKNGARRSNDIHQKLEHHASSPTQLLPIVSKLHIFHPKKVGIKIRNCDPLLLENRSSFYMKQEGGDILSRIFRFGRSRPIVVSKEFGVNKDHTSICGVALGQGSVCTRKPVEERKRCTEHKGMKVNGSKPKLIAEQCRPGGFSPTCGVAFDDGSVCSREPVTGRKRCEEHKGRRINGFISSPIIVEDKYYVHGPVLKSRTPCESDTKTNIDTICGVDMKDRSFCTRPCVLGHERCEEHNGIRLDEHKSKIFRNSIDGGSSLTCGVTTLDGSPCQRKPGNCRKWCWQHVPERVDSCSSSQSIPCKGYSNGDYSYSSTCAAITQKGTRCSRQAAGDSQTCWQHLGMRVDSCSSSQSIPCKGYSNEGYSYSSTCATITQKGTRCSRQAAGDSQTCWQHLGMRVDSCSSSQSIPCKSINEGYSYSSTCVAITQKGTRCSRQAARDSQTCWQH